MDGSARVSAIILEFAPFAAGESASLRSPANREAGANFKGRRIVCYNAGVIDGAGGIGF
jgi:hypothetical protein